MIQPRVALLLAFVLVALVTPDIVARAQDAPPPTPPADALIDRGVALRRTGDDEGALAAFSQAWDAGHAPRARAQMGLAEQALGRWVDANRHLEEALGAVDDPWIARNRPALEAAVSTVRTHTGRLELRGGVDGAQVVVNGQSAGALPLVAPVIVEAGSVVVEVRAAGYYPMTRTFEVTSGGLSRETVTLVPQPEGTTPTVDDGGARSVAPTDALDTPEGGTHAHHQPAPPPTDAGAVPRALAIAAFSSAAVTLALSIAAVVVYDDNAAAANSTACDPLPPMYLTRGDHCPSTYSTAYTARDWATAGFVVTGVLAAAGIVSLILAATAHDGPAPTSRLVCGPTLGTVGVVCSGAL